MVSACVAGKRGPSLWKNLRIPIPLFQYSILPAFFRIPIPTFHNSIIPPFLSEFYFVSPTGTFLNSTGLAVFARRRMLSISTKTEKAIAK